MPIDRQEIRDYVESRRDQFISQLIEFCGIPSVTLDRKAGDRACHFLVNYMISLDVSVETIKTEGNPIIVGNTAPGAVSSFSYYSHYDVVPVGSPDDWQSDPFTVSSIGDRLVGRGVADHKGWLLSRLQGLEVLRNMNVDLQRSVEFVFEGDEELGSGPLESLVKNGGISLASDVVLYSGWQRLADGTPRINGGGRGVLEVHIEVKNARKDLHGSYAPIVTHPLSYLTVLVSQLITSNGSVLLPGFYDQARKPDPADLKALDEIPYSFRDEKERLGFSTSNTVSVQSTKREVLEQLYFVPVGYPKDFSTSGNSGSVVPRSASALLHFSLVPDQDPYALFRYIREHVRKLSELPVEVELKRAIPPARTRLDSAGFDLIRAACHAWRNSPPLIVPFSSGSGPRHLFIHDLAMDMIVDVGVSDVDSNDHGPNENIRTDHYLEGIVHAAHTILQAQRQFSET